MDMVSGVVGRISSGLIRDLIAFDMHSYSLLSFPFLGMISSFAFSYFLCVARLTNANARIGLIIDVMVVE